MHSISCYDHKIDINKFIKGRTIGIGGFGNILLAKKKKTGKEYAAKVFDFNNLNESNKKMIEREISIMAFIKHPTIINFIGYSLQDFDHNNKVTLIMELAENGSLAKILKNIQNGQGPDYYNNTNRQIILIGIAFGMKYLHDRNIIHRDLKPANILLDANYRPMISDFGLSKISEFEDPMKQSQYGGTFFYMAPEVFETKPYDNKVDVYSFAIVMYEVLTDMNPYPEINKRLTNIEFIEKIINDNYRPQFKYEIKEPLKNLIEKCWSKNPEDRPTFNEIFNKLAGLSEEKDEYFLNDVDVNEINNYLFDIKEVKNPIEDELIHSKEILENRNYELENKIISLLNHKQQIENENKELKESNDKMKNDIEQLTKYNEHMIDIIEKLTKDNKQMKNYIEELTKDNKQMKNNIIELTKDNKQMKNNIIELIKDEQQVRNDNEQLKKHINELENSNSLEDIKGIYTNNKIINDNQTDHYSKFSVCFIRLVFPVHLEIMKELNINIVPKSEFATLYWYDGLYSIEDFHNKPPSIFINKIPGMHEICNKYVFFDILKVMTKKFPDEYQQFVPLTFCMPKEKNEFETYIQKHKKTWIYKPGNGYGGRGIVIFQDYKKFCDENSLSKRFVFQDYISPFLLDGYKFDIRIYLLLMNLRPLTLFIYKDGIVHFCSEKYQEPQSNIVNNAYSNISSLQINSKNKKTNIKKKLVGIFSSVIKKISINEPRFQYEIWNKIKDLCIKTILALYNDIIITVHDSCIKNDKDFIDDPNFINPFHRFNHFLGLDIMLDNNLNPFILELNDNPDMKSFHGIDYAFKRELAKSEISLIFDSINNNSNPPVSIWEKIFPSNDEVYQRIASYNAEILEEKMTK